MMLRLLRGDFTESFCHVPVASGFGTFRHLGVRLAELSILTDDRICEIVPVLAHKPVHPSCLAEVALLGLRRLLQNLRECDLTFLPRTLRESSVFQNSERLVLHRGFQILPGLRLNLLLRHSQIEGQQNCSSHCYNQRSWTLALHRSLLL